MKIALIGASGFVGSAILQELLARKHQVSAIVTNLSKLPQHPQLSGVAADAYQASQIAAAVAGHDAVISAFNPGWDKADIQALAVKGHDTIVAGVKQAGVKRFLEVGGAGDWKWRPACNWWTPGIPGGMEGRRAGRARSVAPPARRKRAGLDLRFAAGLPPPWRTQRQIPAGRRSIAVQRRQAGRYQRGRPGRGHRRRTGKTATSAPPLHRRRGLNPKPGASGLFTSAPLRLAQRAFRPSEPCHQDARQLPPVESLTQLSPDSIILN